MNKTLQKYLTMYRDIYIYTTIINMLLYWSGFILLYHFYLQALWKNKLISFGLSSLAALAGWLCIMHLTKKLMACIFYRKTKNKPYLKLMADLAEEDLHKKSLLTNGRKHEF